MKCPKCGFNSFEFLDNCKKCNASLTPLKNKLGIRAFVMPPYHIPSSGAGVATGSEVIGAMEAAPADEFSWESPPGKRPFETKDSVADFEIELADLQEGNS